MVIAKYISKTISPISYMNIVKATKVSYEITEEAMNEIASMKSDAYKVQRFILYKDWGNFELVVDNIDNGRVIIGGLLDGKYILNYYEVEKGINELLTLLNQ